ncbi:MAG TPA: preprotein translocase subunit YajC [Acidimicrobiales bacterium]|nr:preprotein translocase subunit YajC [Acidimicrobiales bacterium]
MSALIFPLLLLAAFYFLLLRPQQSRVKSHNNLVSSVAIGDEIVSAGGIVGHVTAIGDRDVQFEIAPGVVVTLAKGAIAQRAPSNAAAPEAGEPTE